MGDGLECRLERNKLFAREPLESKPLRAQQVIGRVEGVVPGFGTAKQLERPARGCPVVEAGLLTDRCHCPERMESQAQVANGILTKALGARIAEEFGSPPARSGDR